jgi:hypothetical protein
VLKGIPHCSIFVPKNPINPYINPESAAKNMDLFSSVNSIK